MRITSRGTHYDHDDVIRRLDYGVLIPGGVDRAVFLLARLDSIWNPASTTRLIPGPARVEFTRHPDGGIHVYVGDLISGGVR